MRETLSIFRGNDSWVGVRVNGEHVPLPFTVYATVEDVVAGLGDRYDLLDYCNGRPIVGPTLEGEAKEYGLSGPIHQQTTGATLGDT